MSKALAVKTLYLIGVTMIFLFFAVIIFVGWLNITSKMANPAICNSKLLGYCSDWSRSDYQSMPYNWNSKASGCVKIGISPGMEKCKELLQQK